MKNGPLGLLDGEHLLSLFLSHNWAVLLEHAREIVPEYVGIVLLKGPWLEYEAVDPLVDSRLMKQGPGAVQVPSEYATVDLDLARAVVRAGPSVSSSAPR